mmetsp:Transcript_92609/g.146405  ORF Transcript_92609/g.146405 Transcript_92609/m.146405 type:complete len:433 (-) Transcript_92609:319-1617(-)
MTIPLTNLHLVLLALGLENNLARRQRIPTPSWYNGGYRLYDEAPLRMKSTLTDLMMSVSSRSDWTRLRGGQRGQEEIVDVKSEVGSEADAADAIDIARLRAPKRLKELKDFNLTVPKIPGLSRGTPEVPEKLKPFKRGRPTLVVDNKKLNENGVWYTQRLLGNIAFTQGIMNVNASPSIVWKQLFDFDSYPQKCPVICAAEVYKRRVETNQPKKKVLAQRVDDATIHTQGIAPPIDFFDGMLPNISTPRIIPIIQNVSRDARQRMASFVDNNLQQFRTTQGGCNNEPFRLGNAMERIYVRFASPILPGFKMINHCDMTYEPARNSVTYTLDGDKKNDFKDLQGHWHVAPHPDGSGRSHVYYEIALATPRWLPRRVVNQLNKIVVKEATFWVKKESESQALRSRNAVPKHEDHALVKAEDASPQHKHRIPLLR